MKAKNVKLSLLCIFIGMALYPADVLASKLTVEQRLELLESELSANKKNCRKQNMNLAHIKIKLRPYRKVLLKIAIVILPFQILRPHHLFLKTLTMKTVKSTNLVPMFQSKAHNK